MANLTEQWLGAAAQPLEQLKRTICTAGDHDVVRHRDCLHLPADFRVNRVLDFGCGLGRNFPLLREFATHVTAYDLPPMLARCQALAPADAMFDEWAVVRQRRFDLIFAALVLQHLPVEVLYQRLQDFAQMAPRLLLESRDYLDVGGSLLPYLQQAGFSEVYRQTNPQYTDHWVGLFTFGD